MILLQIAGKVSKEEPADERRNTRGVARLEDDLLTVGRDRSVENAAGGQFFSKDLDSRRFDHFRIGEPPKRIREGDTIGIPFGDQTQGSFRLHAGGDIHVNAYGTGDFPGGIE